MFNLNILKAIALVSICAGGILSASDAVRSSLIRAAEMSRVAAAAAKAAPQAPAKAPAAAPAKTAAKSSSPAAGGFFFKR